MSPRRSPSTCRIASSSGSRDCRSPCSCRGGAVPVARRLILRGVHPAAGVAFMVASPVMNPIVLASTWVA
ncbi:MAG TPA: permease [Gaiellaceae bacterium]